MAMFIETWKALLLAVEQRARSVLSLGGTAGVSLGINTAY